MKTLRAMTPEFFKSLRATLRGSPWQASWDLPKWQAHRGYHHEGIPENTLASLIEAQKRGALMCEFDVRLTKDQIPILFHDQDLSRMLGRTGALADVTLAELRKEATVTTLDEVLRSDEVPRFLNIELKSEEVWNDPLERRVSDVIRKVGRQHRILFSSFNPVSLWKLTQFLPQVPRALLVAANMPNTILREMALAPMLSLQALHFDQALLPDESSIQLWKSKGFKVAVWTVNDQDRMAQYQDWGIDSVITDLIPNQRPEHFQSESALEFPSRNHPT